LESVYEVADEQVDLDRVAGMGAVARPGQLDEPGPVTQGVGQQGTGARSDDLRVRSASR